VGREGWGGIYGTYTNDNPTFTNNRRDTFSYDAAGNLTNDLGQTFTYDATGQQAYASGTGLTQSYDGNGLRAKKSENGTVTWYLRSSALGGQVVAEMDGSGAWMRGYVYQGGSLLAVQAGGVNWVHQDPVTKSQRVTDNLGNVISTVDLDPWGGETARSSNQAFQPHRYTTYERDSNGSDEAMFRRYNRWWSCFDQPDPYDGSYNLADPQSFNRYAYTQNDPVNFVDPSGLSEHPATLPPPRPMLPPFYVTVTAPPTLASNSWLGGGGGGMHDPLLDTGNESGEQGGGRLGPGAAVPQKTPTQKKQDYQNCLKNVSAIFSQAHRAIPNVFHNSLPGVRQTAGILFGTTVRTAATGIAVGSITVSGAAPLVVSTAVTAYAATWGFNVASNTVSNAAQRGTLLGEEFKARIGCRVFLQ